MLVYRTVAYGPTVWTVMAVYHDQSYSPTLMVVKTYQTRNLGQSPTWVRPAP